MASSEIWRSDDGTLHISLSGTGTSCSCLLLKLDCESGKAFKLAGHPLVSAEQCQNPAAKGKKGLCSLHPCPYVGLAANDDYAFVAHTLEQLSDYLSLPGVAISRADTGENLKYVRPSHMSASGTGPVGGKREGTKRSLSPGVGEQQRVQQQQQQQQAMQAPAWGAEPSRAEIAGQGPPNKKEKQEEGGAAAGAAAVRSSTPTVVKRLRVDRPSGNWQTNPCGAVFVLVDSQKQASFDAEPGARLLGVFRCGNEAGARSYCSKHREHPLYLVFRDETTRGLKSKAELAQELGCDKVELEDMHGDLEAKLANPEGSRSAAGRPGAASVAAPAAGGEAASSSSSTAGAPSFTGNQAILRLHGGYGGSSSSGGGGISGGQSGTGLPREIVLERPSQCSYQNLPCPGMTLTFPPGMQPREAIERDLLNGQLCGNEAGIKGRCRRHAQLFLVQQQGDQTLRGASSLPDLAKVLSVAKVELLGEEGQPLEAYRAALTQADWEVVQEGESRVLQVWLPKPEGNWQTKACLGVDFMVENVAGTAAAGQGPVQVLGLTRCGNEAGSKRNCRNHTQLFHLYTATQQQATPAIATCNSLRELAAWLQVSKAEMYGGTTRSLLLEYQQLDLLHKAPVPPSHQSKATSLPPPAARLLPSLPPATAQATAAALFHGGPLGSTGFRPRGAGPWQRGAGAPRGAVGLAGAAPAAPGSAAVGGSSGGAGGGAPFEEAEEQGAPGAGSGSGSGSSRLEGVVHTAPGVLVVQGVLWLPVDLKPTGAWQKNPCRALTIALQLPRTGRGDFVPGSRYPILSVTRCGNESGVKARCKPHNDGTFVLTDPQGLPVARAPTQSALCGLLGLAPGGVKLYPKGSYEPGKPLEELSAGYPGFREWSPSNSNGTAAKVPWGYSGAAAPAAAATGGGGGEGLLVEGAAGTGSSSGPGYPVELGKVLGGGLDSGFGGSSSTLGVRPQQAGAAEGGTHGVGWPQQAGVVSDAEVTPPFWGAGTGGVEVGSVISPGPHGAAEQAGVGSVVAAVPYLVPTPSYLQSTAAQRAAGGHGEHPAPGGSAGGFMGTAPGRGATTNGSPGTLKGGGFGKDATQEGAGGGPKFGTTAPLVLSQHHQPPY